MNYKIIHDKEKLEAFIDWLPELEKNEKFYCCLFARKKYAPDLVASSDKAQLKRFVSDKSRLYDKIKQLEVELGAYKLKNVDAPQESLAFYINPNPRNLKKATFEGIIRLTDLLRRDQDNFNPHAEMLSAIQKTIGRKIYLDFDVDTKEFDFVKLYEVINKDCLTIVETRGGYHVLVKLEDVSPDYRKSFYNNIIKLGVDQTGDQLLPVPGCIQGEFVPKKVQV